MDGRFAWGPQAASAGPRQSIMALHANCFWCQYQGVPLSPLITISSPKSARKTPGAACIQAGSGSH